MLCIRLADGCVTVRIYKSNQKSLFLKQKIVVINWDTNKYYVMNI